ncbi:unnamed protein product [Dibothriocephalus latus]|uniref:Uncharacterized protein n=1 Tax=Dibothriocephalus latus TaxID=60516 RepID=A0A3P7R804_DIBLA|nr:unnamed protein product [Dibothriocephalus latus]
MPLSSNLRLNGLQPVGPGAASADFLTNSGLANHADLYSHSASSNMAAQSGSRGGNGVGGSGGSVVCSGSSSDPRHFYMDRIYPPFTTVSGNSNGGGSGDSNGAPSNFGVVSSTVPTSAANFPYDPSFHSLSVSFVLSLVGFFRLNFLGIHFSSRLYLFSSYISVVHPIWLSWVSQSLYLE